MPNRRYWPILVSLAAGITLFAAGVLVERARTREDRAIANLIRADAEVQLLPAPDGTTCYNVSLDYCEACGSNDELLRYVPDIEGVRGLRLAPLPLHEAGKKSLLRLKGLEALSVYVADTSLSHEAYVELKRGNETPQPGS